MFRPRNFETLFFSLHMHLHAKKKQKEKQKNALELTFSTVKLWLVFTLFLPSTMNNLNFVTVSISVK